MKHRRGIQLGRPRRDEIVYLGPVMDPAHTTLDDIPEWHALGGHCSKCEREGWLLRWELSQKWGKQTYLSSLAPRLRCRSCGNREGNKWILGQLPR
jgi:hypothetical protein